MVIFFEVRKASEASKYMYIGVKLVVLKQHLVFSADRIL